MKKKYKKEKAIMIDLSNRKNIKIIEREKTTITDDEVEIFREQIRSREKEAEEFHKYCIQKELETKKRISDEEFNSEMSALLKQNKILKYLLKGQEK